MNKHKASSLVAALAVAAVGVAVIGPVRSQLVNQGLIHPINGFPTWFSDSNGVTLQLCLDGDGLTGPCSFDAPVVGNAFSQRTGFGPEAFWWSADASLDLVGGRSALVVLALEAAYANEDPAPGDQFAFGRVRIRIDTPVAGEYKVWHPYLDESTGCAPEVFDAAAGIRAINVTRDIGGGAPFDTMLDGEVGPFLIWDPAVMPAAPAGYVGVPGVEHKVVGGHCGINYFKIEAPAGVNLDGSGSNVVQTPLFSVQGKIYDETNTPPAIAPVRASYFRSTSSTSGTTARVNTWVEAPPGSAVSLSGLPQTTKNGPMTHDGNGGFFKRSSLSAAYGLQVPDQVMVTATNASGATTTQAIDLVDTVYVTSASWTASTRALSIVATSSDKIAVSAGAIPALSVRVGSTVTPMPQSGAAGRYAITLSGFATPPARVTVTSSEGGSETRRVAD